MLRVALTFIRSIHIRRFKWLGQILRAGPSRLIYQAVVEQHRLVLPGNILMDAPPHTYMMNLTAKDRGRSSSLESYVKNLVIGVTYLFTSCV